MIKAKVVDMRDFLFSIRVGGAWEMFVHISRKTPGEENGTREADDRRKRIVVAEYWK